MIGRCGKRQMPSASPRKRRPNSDISPVGSRHSAKKPRNPRIISRALPAITITATKKTSISRRSSVTLPIASPSNGRASNQKKAFSMRKNLSTIAQSSKHSDHETSSHSSRSGTGRFPSGSHRRAVCLRRNFRNTSPATPKGLCAHSAMTYIFGSPLMNLLLSYHILIFMAYGHLKKKAGLRHTMRSKISFAHTNSHTKQSNNILRNHTLG